MRVLFSFIWLHVRISHVNCTNVTFQCHHTIMCYNIYLQNIQLLLFNNGMLQNEIEVSPFSLYLYFTHDSESFPDSELNGTKSRISFLPQHFVDIEIMMHERISRRENLNLLHKHYFLTTIHFVNDLCYSFLERIKSKRCIIE